MPVEPGDLELYEEWLTGAAGLDGDGPGAAAGRQARAAGDGHPQRQGGVRPPPAHAGRPTTTAGPGRSTSCRSALGLPEAPLRIECYDMSHIQGTDYVGSMVVLEDGLPKKSEYRRFKIKSGRRQRRLRGHGGGAHPPAHRLPRRARAAASSERAASSPTRRSCCWSTAARASSAWPCGCSRSSGLDDEIPVASLAKRFEEVYVPGQADPVRIPRQSEALYLLQRIRDEAHRFAITFHRELRGKRMTDVGARRHPRPRADPQEAAGQGARRRERGEAGVARGAARRCRGCPTRWPRPSTTRSTPPRPPLTGPPTTGASARRGDRGTPGGRR